MKERKKMKVLLEKKGKKERGGEKNKDAADDSLEGRNNICWGLSSLS